MNQLNAMLDWYTSLTPHNIRRVGEFYAPDATFRDPFNVVQGIKHIEAIFYHMFDNTVNPRFVIDQRVVQQEQAFVTWTFQFSLRGKPYEIVGGTHFVFNSDGLVVQHRDYWDAAEELFQKLPVVGGPIRWLRQRFKTVSDKSL
jgi:nuclear transport factor 2 (NTF2) superfamily protein